MSTRDYEEQPEAPDLGQEVQEDTALTLVGPPGADPLDAGYVPPDRPYLADDDEAVHREQSLTRRLDRERPDVTPDDPHAVTDRDPYRAPRLAPDEAGADGVETESGVAAGTGLAGGAATAEEAAVHVETDDPPFDDGLPDRSEEIGDVGRVDALGVESDAARAEAARDATADADAVPGRRVDADPERGSGH
jgi:hypothetical protein